MLYKTKIKPEKDAAVEYLVEAESISDVEIKLRTHFDGIDININPVKEVSYTFFEETDGDNFYELSWSYENPDGKVIKETAAGWFDDVKTALTHFTLNYKIKDEMFEKVTLTKIVEFIK